MTLSKKEEQDIAKAKKDIKEQVEKTKRENLGLDADGSSSMVSKLKSTIDLLSGDIEGYSPLSEK